MGLRSYVKQLNYSYEVTTGLYMLEPWEKAVFSTFALHLSLAHVFSKSWSRIELRTLLANI